MLILFRKHSSTGRYFEVVLALQSTELPLTTLSELAQNPEVIFRAFPLLTWSGLERQVEEHFCRGFKALRHVLWFAA
jgi:hypothetical protein